MNAFEKLMQGASQKASEQRGVSKRGQQQHEQQQQAKRLKLDTSSSAPLPQTSAFSCDQLVCGSQQDLSSSLGSPAAASSHQDAVAAFKRVFSGRMQHRKQKFDYLIVYDLEATCNSGKDLAPVEIIELSCAIVDTQTAEIQGCFQVRYMHGLFLATKMLTGITGNLRQELHAGLRQAAYKTTSFMS